MKNPSTYLKMRVLGAIDLAQGRTSQERLKNVAAMTFTDDDGNPRQFTWRTITVYIQLLCKGIFQLFSTAHILAA